MVFQMNAMRIAILTTDTREEIAGCTDPQPHLGLAPEALLQGFALVPEAEVHVVSCLKEPIRSVEKIEPNIFYHGVAVPRLGWLRTGYQGCIRAVRKKLKAIQPDIIHGQGTERDCAISAVFSGFPNVVTVHGNMRMIAAVNRARPFSYLWLAAKLEGFTLPRTDGVVCISHYTQTAVAKLARKTWILPNAVDANFFDVQAVPTLDALPIGLCVGTICARKNQNDFVRALDPLAREKKFKIIFAGGLDQGSYGAEFQQLIAERPWCEHIGYLNREQLRAQLKSATFLALPTREDNCPMVVLEAMAAGVPVLASAVGGVPDLVAHEVNGLLCNPDQPETFRAAVKRFLDDPEFARQLATMAKTEALRRFHPQVIAQKHLQIYREVLGN
jgi:glycosyltransferase involved in cell wall biosynthesis